MSTSSEIPTELSSMTNEELKCHLSAMGFEEVDLDRQEMIELIISLAGGCGTAYEKEDVDLVGCYY